MDRDIIELRHRIMVLERKQRVLMDYLLFDMEPGKMGATLVTLEDWHAEKRKAATAVMTECGVNPEEWAIRHGRRN
jgi:hypothetical protein